MYMDFKVKIPDVKSKIFPKTVKGVTYINYEYERVYKPEKKYNIPNRTTIGKLCDGDTEMMYPNVNYLKFFPDAELPEDAGRTGRSGCLRIGAHIVIRKIIEGYKLGDMVSQAIGAGSGLFLDLVSYSIICENNAGQYYPDYAYNHPLFTDGMRVYSDATVSEFLNSMTTDQAAGFLNEWNGSRNREERIYISYDSTNKTCQAGDIEIVEFGRPKDGSGKPVFNYSIAYDPGNREPLFYEAYPGSIVDVSQLQCMLGKAEGYGYRNVGFILDRGYFSKENIRFMDGCGYDFVIMVKGTKPLVNGLITGCRGTFEESRQHSIRGYGVNGTTVESKLFPSDEKERFFHIYYSSEKYAFERSALEAKVDRMAEYLHKQEGKPVKIDKSFEQYFELFYHSKGRKNETFMFGKEKEEVIEREIRLCGYFSIITSEGMTAEEALTLYKSRDGSEKLFRGDKSYLGNKSLRVQSNESIDAKIFIEFVALIIRNKIYTSLKDEMEETGKRPNYMTVPAAVKELEKIEMVRLPDNVYRLDHAVTATQKAILKAFGLDAGYVKARALDISGQLAGLRQDNVKRND
jgi:transposase